MLAIPESRMGQIKQYLKMAQRFKPELVEDAMLKVVDTEDLEDEERDNGIGMILYADEATYTMAAQYGVAGGVAVDSIPAQAQDYFDI